MIECTGIAIRGEGWIALCPEYDIAGQGATQTDALIQLQFKIRQAVELAQSNQLAIGRPVSQEALAKFVAGHLGEVRPVRWHYRIDTDGPDVFAVLGEPL